MESNNLSYESLTQSMSSAMSHLNQMIDFFTPNASENREQRRKLQHVQKVFALIQNSLNNLIER